MKNKNRIGWVTKGDKRGEIPVKQGETGEIATELDVQSGLTTRSTSFKTIQRNTSTKLTLEWSQTEYNCGKVTAKCDTSRIEHQRSHEIQPMKVKEGKETSTDTATDQRFLGKPCSEAVIVSARTCSRSPLISLS